MLAVIVPYHNDEKRLEKFVRCLNAQTLKPRVLWVNSGSTDESSDVTRDYRGKNNTILLGKNGYWCGCLKAAQEFFESFDVGHIIGVMNNDTEFAGDYFETVEKYMEPGVILSSEIYDAHTYELVQRGVRILWKQVLTRRHGVMPTVCAFKPPYNAFRDCGLFVRVEDFVRVKFHPWLLPHYHTDYYWTMSLIRRGLVPYVPKNLRLYLDFSATPGAAKTLRGLFSKTCFDNPIYLTNYVLLCCPWIWKLPNLVRVWGYGAVRAWRIVFRRGLQ